MIILLSLSHLSTGQWIAIVTVLLLCLIALACYTWTLYQRVPKNYTPLIGKEAVVVAWDGRDRRVEVFGAIWQAQLPSSMNVTIHPGDIVTVQDVDNLVLLVTPTGEKL
jgi:membrane protein implicated in regulation of membrane protease activity